MKPTMASQLTLIFLAMADNGRFRHTNSNPIKRIAYNKATSNNIINSYYLN